MFARRQSICACGAEVADEPGNDDLAEDDWVGPDLDLTAEMAALGIDPRFFGNIAAAEDQVGVGNWNLSVQCAGDEQHGRSRFADEALRNKRHFGEDGGQV